MQPRLALAALLLMTAVLGVAYFMISKPPASSTDRVLAGAEQAAPAGPSDALPSLDITVRDRAPASAEEDDTLSMGPEPQETVQLRDRVQLLEQTVADLESENAQLRQALLLAQYPADSPWGHALRMPEIEAIADDKVRSSIRSWLEEDFPILVQPGELTWIAERERSGDWKRFAPTMTEAMVIYLGPERLLREMPDGERMDELLAKYPQLFGRR